jgi:hypothetical protein
VHEHLSAAQLGCCSGHVIGPFGAGPKKDRPAQIPSKDWIASDLFSTRLNTRGPVQGLNRVIYGRPSSYDGGMIS